MGPWRWLAANRQLDRLANPRQPPCRRPATAVTTPATTAGLDMAAMDVAIQSGERKLAAYVARPARSAAGPRPALVLCHGFPAGARGALTSAQTYPDLADHLAAETGWTVVAFNFRGTGESEGDFSLLGWLDDLRAVVDHAVDMPRTGGVW